MSSGPGLARTAGTITEKVSAISCPAGVTLDLSHVDAIWIFLNGGDVYVDNIRAEAG